MHSGAAGVPIRSKSLFKSLFKSLSKWHAYCLAAHPHAHPIALGMTPGAGTQLSPVSYTHLTLPTIYSL